MATVCIAGLLGAKPAVCNTTTKPHNDKKDDNCEGKESGDCAMIEGC